MLWVAVYLGFFGFLHLWEMTVPSDTHYNSTVHLSKSDVAVDDMQKPTVLRITIN